jgi:diguanylate cyclase (GGDEF)-like protein
MFVDIDRFKRVNNSLGHALGDETIREVARRLHRTVRPMDTVSRFGGDEFVVMCEVEGGEPEARGIADRIKSALQSPMHFSQRDLEITASIGIAIHRPDERPSDPQTLVRDADTAMYSAKQRGGGAIEFFQPELHEIEVERLELEMALRHAVDRNELRLHYQPIVSLAEGRTKGAEALVRWERPGHGLVSPLEFIPLAESTGMITQIFEWVLEQGLRELSRWQATGWLHDDFELTVNLSPRQLSDPGLCNTVADVLVRTGTHPSTVCLEITESIVMDDFDRAVETLHALKQIGVKLALDDFGVGHSSLGQVARLLPIDVLKVDRSFVGAIDQTRDRAVLQNIASLAGSLDLTAVAEGIETEEQARTVAAMGYPLAQGYLFGAPVPAGEFRAVAENAVAIAA